VLPIAPPQTFTPSNPISPTPTNTPPANAEGPIPQAALASLVAAARRDTDGAQTLTLRMHPDELGPVEVTLQVHHGVVSVALSSASAAARDALSSNLGDLRSALTNAGLQLGTLDVGSGRSGQGQQPGAAAPRTAGRTDASDDAATLSPPLATVTRTATASGVDLHL
jgi:flagellar hook-length control protein FliK